MSNFSWTCPFCDRRTTVTPHDRTSGSAGLGIENAHGPRVGSVSFIVCPNPECKEFVLAASLHEGYRVSSGVVRDKLLSYWSLVPPSNAKVFPDHVPQPIRDDYTEACLIRNLSPKASATLSRRCLQGMIRDFWEIKKNRLVDEINELQNKVDPLVWDAIDATRSVGNIGAHMEKDINIIVEVEPGEADQLIKLIELLVKEWYVNRHEREQSLRAIVKTAEAKKQAKNSPPSAPTATP